MYLKILSFGIPLNIHISVPACLSVLKIDLFLFWRFSNSRSVISPKICPCPVSASSSLIIPLYPPLLLIVSDTGSSFIVHTMKVPFLKWFLSVEKNVCSPMYTGLFTFYSPSHYPSSLSSWRPKSKKFPFFTNFHFPLVKNFVACYRFNFDAFDLPHRKFKPLYHKS